MGFRIHCVYYALPLLPQAELCLPRKLDLSNPEATPCMLFLQGLSQLSAAWVSLRLQA